MGGAESAQSPGSHTLNWSHGDLACVASPTYFMGLRSPVLRYSYYSEVSPRPEGVWRGDCDCRRSDHSRTLMANGAPKCETHV